MTVATSARPHPLDAVPIVPAETRAHPIAGNRLLLSRELPARDTARDRFARWLGIGRIRRAELCERGTCFWQAIDGTTSLRTIAQHLAIQWDVTEDDSRQACVLFTKMLMTRGLLALRLPGTPEQIKPGESDT